MGNQKVNVAVVLITLLLLVAISFAMFVIPLWNVWRMELSGKAQLAKAESTRRTQVIQAQAEKDAAQLRADAIAIVGKAAQAYPEYRQQEFIGAFAEALKEGKINQIMYVPTEANIPITEAGRNHK